jgi:predicted Zn-dependent protease
MRYADDNHTPRGWRNRPGPVGPRSKHRPGCHAPTGCGSHRGSAHRGGGYALFLPVPAGDALSFHRGFTFVPLTTDPAPAAVVPGPAGLVSMVLEAAQANFAAGRYAVADAFLRLIRQPAADPAVTWRELGHLYFAMAEYEAAGRAYGYAAAYDPRDASLQVRLAHTCLLLDDIASFEGYLQRALTLDPESVPALQLLGDLSRDEGLYAEAAGSYERLIQAAPGQYETLLSLALCHSHLGDNEAALNWLQRAGRAARGSRAPTQP